MREEARRKAREEQDKQERLARGEKESKPICGGKTGQQQQGWGRSGRRRGRRVRSGRGERRRDAPGVAWLASVESQEQQCEPSTLKTLRV